MKAKPKQPTTPAEEWGERVETGRQIARGGKSSGCVPGAVGDDVHDPRSGGPHCAEPDVGVPAGMPPPLPESDDPAPSAADKS